MPRNEFDHGPVPKGRRRGADGDRPGQKEEKLNEAGQDDSPASGEASISGFLPPELGGGDASRDPQL